MKIKYFLLFVLYLLIGCFTINVICILVNAPAILPYVLCILFGMVLGHWLYEKTMV